LLLLTRLLAAATLLLSRLLLPAAALLATLTALLAALAALLTTLAGILICHDAYVSFLGKFPQLDNPACASTFRTVAHILSVGTNLGDRIAPLALKHHIPIVSANPELTVVGGLISYGAPRRQNYRRAAYFVRKIFDGAKPADLPVEQPTRILLTANLKTAKLLDIDIPPALLALADEVIE
jgi:ABC transporter substrate binding protein